MSFGKKLLGVFFEGIENTEPTKTPDPNQPLKPQMTSQPVATTTVMPSINTTQTVNTDLKEHITNLIKENNFPGPDYYEFILMLDALKGVPMPDIRYTSAFAALSAQGMTKQQLLDTAEKYKVIVKNDQAEFEKEFAGVFKAQVEDKKALVDTKAKEIQELSTKIQSLSEEMKALNSDVSAAETQLTIQKAQYINAGNSVVSDIDAELSNIQMYIK